AHIAHIAHELIAVQAANENVIAGVPYQQVLTTVPADVIVALQPEDAVSAAETDDDISAGSPSMISPPSVPTIVAFIPLHLGSPAGAESAGTAVVASPRRKSRAYQRPETG